jgi:4'-phosphopantetheinyl transferase
LHEAVALPELGEVQFEAVRVAHKPAEPEWFTEPERATHAAFRVAKRADEWRAGRLAAKRAVCATHPGLAPRDVEVRGDEAGKPHVFVAGQQSPLHLSLTHRDGLAIAALSPHPVGIDLETIEAREQSFLETAFAVPELKVLLASPDANTDVACMWAAKEAALKRAGVGLKADLRAHQVTADDSGGALVEGPSGRFGIRFYQVDGKVLAVSAPELDAVPARGAA